MMSLKFTTICIVVFMILISLGSMIKPSMQAKPFAVTSTPTPSPYWTPTANAEMTMMYLRATDTIVAIAKTEEANYSARQTQAAVDFQHAVQATNQAAEVAAVSTQNALIAQAQGTAQASATNGVSTMMAALTQGAAGGATATQAFWANVTATQLAATQQIENDALNAKRVGIWGFVVLLLLTGVLGVTFLAVHIWRIWKAGKADYIQASKVEPDQQGRYPAVPMDALGRDHRLIVPNLAHRAVIDPEHDDLSTEQALQNKRMVNELDATRAIAHSPAFVRQLTRKTAATEKDPELLPASLQISKPGLPMLGNPMLAPSFSMIEDWDGKGGIPYGVSGNGLEFLNLQDVPHGGVFGKTGKGKSRYFLRPFIAGAVAAGHRVIILGKQADFWPFASHGNVTMIPVRHITEPEEASRYAGYLKSIVKEMNRRDEFLTSQRVSTWDRAGRENTLIVLDELGNVLDMMPRDVAQDAYRLVQGLAKEGRKVGFNIWLATQRAVGFKSIVEQLGRAVFYLEDAEASRIALGFTGAEELQDGYFFAKFHRTKKCSAFDPTDDELVGFLQNRAVKLHEPINWIEGTATDVVSEPANDVESQIRDALERMRQAGNVSLSQVQREVFGDVNTGGANFRRIQKIWIEMQAERATTTGNMPDPGVVAGSATSSAV